MTQSPEESSESTSGPKANPLLAGLFLPTTSEEIVRAIARDPFRDPTWCARNRDPALLHEYLLMVVIPTTTTIRIAKSLYAAIRRGLFLRDPSNWAMRQGFYSNTSSFEITSMGVAVDGQVLLGETGKSKSYSIKAALRALPLVLKRGPIPSLGLEHVEQIVYLYIEMTSIIAMEGLLTRILYGIDSTLRKNGELARATRSGCRSIEALMEAVLRLMKTHLVGILVIDEIQAANFGLGSKDARRLRNFLLSLLNSGIPVYFSGNPLAVRFEEHRVEGKRGKANGDKAEGAKISAQLQRRLLGDHPLRLDVPLNAAGEDLKTLLRGLGRCTLLPERTEITQPMIVLVYNLTAGIEDFVVALWEEAQRRALKANDKKIDEECLRAAAKQCAKLKKFERMIRGFVNRNADLLSEYTDIDISYYKRRWFNDAVTENTDQTQNGASAPAAAVTGVVTTYNIASGADPQAVAGGIKRTLEAANTRQKERNAQDNDQLESLKRHHVRELRAMLEKQD